jgi:uncharacterized membrane protein
MNVYHRLLVFVALVVLIVAGRSTVGAQDSSTTSSDEPTLETQVLQDAPVLTPDPAFAESMPVDQYYRAVVLEVLDSGDQAVGTDETMPFQRLRVRVMSGQEKGQEVEVDNGKKYSITKSQLLKQGDQFILVKGSKVDGSSYYAVLDHYRLNQLIWLGILFLILVAVVARWRGVMSFLGLVVSIGVLALYEVPRLARGEDPLLTTLVALPLIVLATIYLAHGFSRQTTIAVASTVLTLFVASGLAMLFVALTHLTGGGSEEAFNLQFGQNIVFDLKGIFLSGILIGVVGVLDDVTTGQVAVVDQLHHANPALGAFELFKRASIVGREHILSLVNTLALAYAGISLPLFLILASNPQPLWMTLNSEFFAEEIVRTLIGSSALVLAVPIATALAARFLAHTKPTDLQLHLHSHSH